MRASCTHRACSGYFAPHAGTLRPGGNLAVDRLLVRFLETATFPVPVGAKHRGSRATRCRGAVEVAGDEVPWVALQVHALNDVAVALHRAVHNRVGRGPLGHRPEPGGHQHPPPDGFAALLPAIKVRGRRSNGKCPSRRFRGPSRPSAGSCPAGNTRPKDVASDPSAEGSPKADVAVNEPITKPATISARL